MTLAAPRGFHREIIIHCGILKELSEVIINMTTKDLTREW